MVKICANMYYQVSFFFFFCDKFEIDGTTRKTLRIYLFRKFSYEIRFRVSISMENVTKIKRLRCKNSCK